MEGKPESSEVADAIRELAHQVDALGNAVVEIAKAIRSTNTGGTGVSQSGTLT
jgi:hypothetical protein